MDLKGGTTFGLLDQKINAKWDVIDAQNLTKGRDLSIDLGGQHVDHVLAKGSDPVSFPVTVTGTLSAPDYSYTEVPQHFISVAMSNMSGAAKTTVMKKLTDAAPAPAKKLLEGFGKKFFK